MSRRPDAGRSEAVAAIVEELRTGVRTEENFRRLFDLYYRSVSHFFAKRGFSPEDCRDLTQETFLGTYRSIGSFRAEAKFDTWLFTIASNVYRKRLRSGAAAKRMGREVALTELEEVGGTGSAAVAAALAPAARPDGRVLAEERRRRLRETIATLPDQMRKCLVLRVYYDLKYREVAEVMRLSVDTVKAHLFQARQRVKDLLGEDFEDVDL